MTNLNNPFEAIDLRLTRIEEWLADIKGVLPPAKPPKEYLTKKEVAVILQVTTVTIDNYRRAGKLKGHRVGNTVRFKHADLVELIEGKKEKASTPGAKA